jgi:hypothetical protein
VLLVSEFIVVLDLLVDLLQVLDVLDELELELVQTLLLQLDLVVALHELLQELLQLVLILLESLLLGSVRLLQSLVELVQGLVQEFLLALLLEHLQLVLIVLPHLSELLHLDLDDESYLVQVVVLYDVGIACLVQAQVAGELVELLQLAVYVLLHIVNPLAYQLAYLILNIYLQQSVTLPVDLGDQLQDLYLETPLLILCCLDLLILSFYLDLDVLS